VWLARGRRSGTGITVAGSALSHGQADEVLIT